MKKFYLTTLTLILFGGISAQHQKLSPTFVKDQKQVRTDFQTLKNGAIWTNDFSNPADWRMENSSNPDLDWQIGTAADWPTTLTGQNYEPLMSTSGGNFAFIDSDGAGGSSTQDADLILVNPIDLTNEPLVSVTLENWHRRFLETHTLSVSTDGTTWNNIVINDSYDANSQSSNPELILVDISEFAGGQSTVYLKFNYQGAWDWFWAIDDVCIVQTPETDIVVRDVWTGDIVNDYEYQAIPQTQVHPLSFGVEMSNIGGVSQQNVGIEASVTYPGGTEVFSTSLANFPKGTDTTIWFDGILPSDIGVYDVTFNVIPLAADFTPANNMMEKSFQVTDGLFGQADEWRSTFLFDSDAGGAPYASLTLGQSYKIYEEGDVVYGLMTIFPNSQGDFTADQYLATTLFQFLDNGTPDPEAMDDIVTGDYTVNTADLSAGGGDAKWIFLEFDDYFTVEKGEVYMGAIDIPGGSEQYNVPSDGANDDAGCFIYGDVDNSGNERWVVYSNVNIPILLVTDRNIGLREDVITARKVKTFPNPTNGISTIQLAQGEHIVGVPELLDVSGKLIIGVDEAILSVDNDGAQIDFSEMMDGIYFVQMVTNRGIVRERIVVKH